MRCHAQRAAGSAQSRDAFELIAVDDLGARDGDPVFALGNYSVVVGRFVVIDPGVGFARKDASEVAIGKLRTAQSGAAIIQRLYDPATAAPLIGPVEDLTND